MYSQFQCIPIAVNLHDTTSFADGPCRLKETDASLGHLLDDEGHHHQGDGHEGHLHQEIGREGHPHLEIGHGGHRLQEIGQEGLLYGEIDPSPPGADPEGQGRDQGQGLRGTGQGVIPHLRTADVDPRGTVGTGTGEIGGCPIEDRRLHKEADETGA